MKTISILKMTYLIKSRDSDLYSFTEEIDWSVAGTRYIQMVWRRHKSAARRDIKHTKVSRINLILFKKTYMYRRTCISIRVYTYTYNRTCINLRIYTYMYRTGIAKTGTSISPWYTSYYFYISRTTIRPNGRFILADKAFVTKNNIIQIKYHSIGFLDLMLLQPL